MEGSTGDHIQVTCQKPLPSEYRKGSFRKQLASGSRQKPMSQFHKKKWTPRPLDLEARALHSEGVAPFVQFGCPKVSSESVGAFPIST